MATTLLRVMWVDNEDNAAAAFKMFLELSEPYTTSRILTAHPDVRDGL